MRHAQLSPGARAVFTTRAQGSFSQAEPANRLQLGRDLGVSLEWMDQVHGRDLCVVSEPTGRPMAATADALIVGPDMPGSAPVVVVADCVPLLLASESGRFRAAVHVGRQGLLLGVAALAVERLQQLAGEPIFAAAGPHVCGRCYEVPAEMASDAAAFGAESTTSWGTPAIDLLAGIRHQLTGVPLAVVPGCTLEDGECYSYRRDKTVGRMAGIVLSSPQR